MLTNKATLGYSASGTTPITYTTLAGLKEIPEFKNEKEKVENTDLSADNKEYEYGIGDYGELKYKFKFANSSVTDSYRIMKALEESGAKVYFKQTYADGTSFTFAGQVTTGVSGGEINKPVDFELSIALASKVELANPTT